MKESVFLISPSFESHTIDREVKLFGFMDFIRIIDPEFKFAEIESEDENQKEENSKWKKVKTDILA